MNIKKFINVVSTVLLLNICISAQQAVPATTSKLLELKVPAPSLKGNLLGDPTEQPIYVYLPPSYATATSKRYPALYLLHGFTSNSRAWVSGGYQGFNMQSSMDELIKSGKVREMIVIAANGSNGYAGSFYRNSPVTGNWEDFIVRHLVGYVDSNYRTITRSESRGIAGHSMGGYGAVMLGMRHPDVFSALYALSPCCLVLEQDLSEANIAWSKVLALTSRDQLKTAPQSFSDFFSLAFIAFSAANSPNSQHAPFFVDFPYEPKPGCNPSATTGFITNTPCVKRAEAIYMKWRANMPTYIAEANKENLKKLNGIFIDYGEKEEFAHIRIGVREFSKTLSELDIPHQFEVYANGDHGSLIRRRLETRVFEFFNEKLVFEK